MSHQCAGTAGTHAQRQRQKLSQHLGDWACGPHTRKSCRWLWEARRRRHAWDAAPKNSPAVPPVAAIAGGGSHSIASSLPGSCNLAAAIGVGCGDDSVTALTVRVRAVRLARRSQLRRQCHCDFATVAPQRLPTRYTTPYSVLQRYLGPMRALEASVQGTALQEAGSLQACRRRRPLRAKRARGDVVR